MGTGGTDVAQMTLVWHWCGSDDTGAALVWYRRHWFGTGGTGVAQVALMGTGGTDGHRWH